MALPLLPLGVGLLGGILSVIGKNKQRKQDNAEAMRREAEAKDRARGKAALMRGILNANGYGNIMTDEQILAYLTKTDPRPNTKGGVLMDIGGGLSGIGKSALLGSPDRLNGVKAAGTTVDPAASADFWDWLNSQIHSTGGGSFGVSGAGVPGAPSL